MLGYRTFFTIAQDRHDLVDTALEQVHSWLRFKGYDADRLEDNARVRVAPVAVAAVVRRRRPDQSEDVRFRLSEDRATGHWITEFTLHVPGDVRGRPWVWIDVDAPASLQASQGRRWTGTPRLATNLLQVLEARDGEARLGPAPLLIRKDDVDELGTMICDSLECQRRGLLFVAGSGTDLTMPLATWQERATRILRHTVGVAGAYVLDPEATEQLASVLGPRYAVSPWTIRTYRPGLDPADESDSVRHRILGTYRLATSSPDELARLLGWRARDSALDAALPDSALRLDRDLDRAYDEILVNAAFDGAGGAVAALTAGRDAGDVEPPSGAPLDSLSLSDDEQTATAAPPRERVLLERMSVIAQSLYGRIELSEQVIDDIASLAAVGADKREAEQVLRHRITELQDRTQALDAERHRLQRELEDEQIEVATAVDEARELRDAVTTLRATLTAAGREPDMESLPRPEPPPGSFAELLARLDDLPYVVFTGSPDVTVSLDNHDALGTWAKKSWDVLLALNGYAERHSRGVFDGSLGEYLQDTPPGAPGFSAARHAPYESKDVKNNRKLAATRHFPVPKEVMRTRDVFMGAHFKIAQSGLISPRLHYYDGTRRSGRIYVGYLGPHLPTKHTN